MERSLTEAASELKARLESGGVRRFPLGGLKGCAGALMVREAALRIERPIIVIAASAGEAEAMAGEIALFLGETDDSDPIARRVHLLPAWELKPLARLSPPREIQAAQLAALFAMQRLEHPVVVASVEALMLRTIPQQRFQESIIRVGIGDRFEFDALLETLAAMGYQRTPQVEEVGDFSVRGSIVDVYSPLYRHPLRLEMEGDELASLRHFEAATQCSLEEVVEGTIIPARYVAPRALKEKKLAERVALRAAEIGMVRKEVAELSELLDNGLLFPGAENMMPLLYDDALSAFFDYLPADAIGWFIDPGRLLAHAVQFSGRVGVEEEAAKAVPAFHPVPASLYLDADEFGSWLDRMIAVEAAGLVNFEPPREGRASAIEIKCQPSLKLMPDSRSQPRRIPSFEPLVTELKETQRGEGRALMVVEGPGQTERLRRHLAAYDIEINTQVRNFAELLEWPDYRPAILIGELSAGAALERDGLYIYSEEDLFGEPRVRRRTQPTPKGALIDLAALKPGDYVVHIDHGIGLYRGLKHLRVAGAEGDFLNLEYAGSDTMYVPVARINLVQRYVGGDGAQPKLARLGSGAWEKVKQRTREAVLAMASELLDVYAAREIQEGHAFPHPGAAYHEFAERFDFEETPDQLAAIDEVVRDMTRPKPMDRLICGDAGFGKTEVALRAAFIAAMDTRQVAVLAPTTVLVEQHWNTMRDRFRDYPVRVEMVSRFRSPRENKAVLEDLRQGKVDIVVGTHRLLQKDVEFRRLGLLIIDEEHRFGVADKEKIKRMRTLVEVLTLTATPIPRTLHMAMAGIRDLSVIQTPPVDRQAIRTFVAHFDDTMLREAILRELNRSGQVFFVHNRVENIEYIARHLRNLVPEAKVAVGHGQMPERELEKVMGDFIGGRVNLLVCSAIIESGLDIPNANTMIINRADRFGLAQLYQLRGRIGRSRQKAYAYLLIPGEHIITREAKRRIEILSELVEVGGGFKLALHDLELRGAGNLLGRQQSGEIAEVGFELYTEMMEQAINELRGQPARLDFEPELQLGVPAYLPEAYIADENERLVLYRRMASAGSAQDLEDLREEVRDRFGPVPTLVENLLAAMDIRRQLKELLITSAIFRGRQLEIRFHPDAPIEVERLAALVKANRERLKLTPGYQVVARIDHRNYEELFSEIGTVLQALAACEKLTASPDREAGPLAN